MWHLIQHWLAYMTGSLNTSGAPPNYNFWSGFGSDISELAIVGGLVSMARKHNCHQPRCWRVGRLPVEGTPWHVCRRHHPSPPGKGSIREQYHLYLGKQPGRG